VSRDEAGDYLSAAHGFEARTQFSEIDLFILSDPLIVLCPKLHIWDFTCYIGLKSTVFQNGKYPFCSVCDASNRREGSVAKLYKVLLVEDSRDLQELFAFVLKSEGYQVITAEDGLLGLRIAEAEQPDVIVTDIAMPQIDGVQMITLLEQRLSLRGIPILALTGYSRQSMKRALEAGADRVRPKRVEPGVLLEEVKVLLGA
jgi:CheY-like chemotaxis protein